jgi:hypothetical protein
MYMRQSYCTASKRLRVAFCAGPRRDTLYDAVGSAITCLCLKSTFGKRAGFGFTVTNYYNARPLGHAFPSSSKLTIRTADLPLHYQTAGCNPIRPHV